MNWSIATSVGMKGDGMMGRIVESGLGASTRACPTPTLAFRTSAGNSWAWRRSCSCSAHGLV